jgi:DNA-binding LytR/AlgR family response regulator
MSELRIVAVDDEPLALEWLRAAIDRLPEAKLVGTATNAKGGLKLISTREADVLLLDIELPDLDGFEIAKRVCAPPPYVIFVTAHPHYAPRAFDQEALDYVVKPVSVERLGTAFAKARKALAAAAALEPARFRSGAEFLVRYRSELVQVHLDEIAWFEGEGDYVRIHVINGRSYLHRATLRSLEEKYAQRGFQRLQKSALVNASMIAAVERQRGALPSIRLTTGAKLVVGRTYAKQFFSLLQG